LVTGHERHLAPSAFVTLASARVTMDAATHDGQRARPRAADTRCGGARRSDTFGRDAHHQRECHQHRRHHHHDHRATPWSGARRAEHCRRSARRVVRVASVFSGGRPDEQLARKEHSAAAVVEVSRARFRLRTWPPGRYDSHSK